MTKPKNPKDHLDSLYESFAENTKDHVLTVVTDQNGMRRLLVRDPSGSFMWGWEIVTWPMALAFNGDIGEDLIFRRTVDMLQFFTLNENRKSANPTTLPNIDFRYWHEKTNVRGDRLKTIDLEFVKYVIWQHLDEHLSDTVIEEYFSDVNDYGEDPVSLHEIENVKRQAHELINKILSDFENSVSYQEPLSAHIVYDWMSDYTVSFKSGTHLHDIIDTTTYLRRPYSLNESPKWLVFGEDFYEFQITRFTDDFYLTCFAIELTTRLWNQHLKQQNSDEPTQTTQKVTS